MARQMERVPITNAFVRTTTAITLFHGGIKVCVCLLVCVCVCVCVCV
jgi:hypothetical protein